MSTQCYSVYTIHKAMRDSEQCEARFGDLSRVWGKQDGALGTHPTIAAFSPPEGADLISHMQLEFSERYPEIPNEANMELGGFPALRISTAGSPGVADYQEIFFIKENRLFKISLIDIMNESNMIIYDRILASFTFSK